MSENKKTLIISIIAVVLFIAAVAAASFAYYTANIETTGEGNASFNATTAQLNTAFDDNEQITIENMIPGDSFDKTFSITNTGSEMNIKIVVNELKNEFTRKPQDITYVLKEDGKVIKEGTFPYEEANNELSNTITLKTGETKRYTLTITYENTEEDQKDDMGKMISGIIFMKQI